MQCIFYSALFLLMQQVYIGVLAVNYVHMTKYNNFVGHKLFIICSSAVLRSVYCVL